MTDAVLITVQPRTVSTGVAATVRLAGGGNLKPYYYGGNHYRAGIAALPRFSAALGFDDQGWNGGVLPTTGRIVWAPALKADLATLAAYYWPKAAITVETGSEDTGSFSTRLVGKVADATVEDGQLVITIADMTAGLDLPVVSARFAGTGTVEGGTEAAGRIKRRTWGRAFNIEGRVLDKATNVYEFGALDYAWQEFTTLRDIGRDASPAPSIIAWAGSIAATLTALKAATPVQGSGVVAPSIACAKWWTQPVGPLTADVKGEIGSGYVETAAAIAERILQAVSGPSITNTAAAVTLRNLPAGIHIDEGESIASAINRLLLGVSLIPVFNPAGTVTIKEFTFSSPVESLISDSVQRQQTLPPVKTRRVGYQQSYRLHSDGEIAATLLALDPTAGSKLDNISVLPLALVSGVTTSDITLSGNSITNVGTNGTYKPVVGPMFAGTASARMQIATGAYFTICALDDLTTGTDYTVQSAILIYRQSDGNCQCYKAGATVTITSSPGAGKTGDIEVRYDGVDYTFWVGDTKVATSAGVGSGLVHYPKFFAYSTGWTYSNLRASYYTDNNTADLEAPGSIEIAANAADTTTTALPLTARCKGMEGTTDKSTTTSFTLGTVPPGIAATINNTPADANRGVITITQADASGNLTVNATVPGYSEITKQIPITRSRSPASSTGGAGSTIVTLASFSNVTSGTHADISAIGTVRSTAGGALTYTAIARHLPSSGIAANTVAIKGRYRTTAGPGAWNDFAAEVTGSANTTDPETGQPVKGVAQIASATKTGLTASTDYDVVLQGRRVTGSDTIVFTNSTFTVNQ